MHRFVTLLLVPALAVAAPVPKVTDTQKIEKLYGKVVDPKGGSKFALDGDKLVITLPANETRSFDYEGGLRGDVKQLKRFTTAPRVERDVEGDFTATVRVTITLDPKVTPIREGYVWSFLCGGIQVSWSDHDWYYLGAMQKLKKGRTLVKCYSFESPGGISKGGGIQVSNETEPPDAVWIQLKRTGKEVVYSVGPDTKALKVILSHPNGAPEGKLTLALSAHHSSDKPHTVTFDQFKVEAKK